MEVIRTAIDGVLIIVPKVFGDKRGYFFEVHPDPDKALSDGPNMLALKDFEAVVKSLLD